MIFKSIFFHKVFFIYRYLLAFNGKKFLYNFYIICYNNIYYNIYII